MYRFVVPCAAVAIALAGPVSAQNRDNTQAAAVAAETLLAQPGQFLRVRDPAGLPNEAVTGTLISVRGDTLLLRRLGGEQLILIAPWSKVDVSVASRRHTLVGVLGGAVLGAAMGAVGAGNVTAMSVAGGAVGGLAGTLIKSHSWRPALLIPTPPDVRRLIAVLELSF